MKHLKTVSVLLLLLVSFAGACSTFLLAGDEELVFGRKYDFGIGYGLLIVNKAGVAKTAFMLVEDKPAAQWVSLYGSLTFNQFGREFPVGGINEVGLVVEEMSLPETSYPKPDDRPALLELQWIQYQLDTAATVEEVLASDEVIRISQNSYEPIHFLIADATGDCATIEFLEGEMVVHRGDELPYPVLTNSLYDASLADLTERKDAPEGSGSLERFCRASEMIKSYSPCPCCGSEDNITRYAFSILDNVSFGELSYWEQWSIVYDIPNRQIHYKTFPNPELRSVKLSSFDFSCDTPVLILDIDSGTGEVDELFTEYSYEANRKLIGEVFAYVKFLQDLPAEVLDELAAYPEELPCINVESVE